MMKMKINETAVAEIPILDTVIITQQWTKEGIKHKVALPLKDMEKIINWMIWVSLLDNSNWKQQPDTSWIHTSENHEALRIDDSTMMAHRAAGTLPDVEYRR